MKKLQHRWAFWTLAMLLAVALTAGALAEGLEIEYDENTGLAVMAAEEPKEIEEEEADITSEAVELPVPESEEALPTGDDMGAEDESADAAVSAASDVTIDKTNFPDAAFREYVQEHFDSDGDGMLSEEERDNVYEIRLVSYKDITGLKGIEWFRNLEELWCYDNQLTSLDVSKNTALMCLSCAYNQLTSLDVSKNAALTELYCYSNQLTSLDVSKNTALTELYCYSNQLTSLDVNGCTALTELSCFSNQLTSLDVSKNTALTNLDCSSNQLTSLDVSGCTALTRLICGSSNHLTSLDVSGCTALTELWCDSNRLTSLDVSKNAALAELHCYGNELTSLDVSGCTALTRLDFSSNELTRLDVSGCTALTVLYCYSNQLTSLDVSKNTVLSRLSCWSNWIDSVDISNCKYLIEASSEEPEVTDEGAIRFRINDEFDYSLEIDPTTTLIANRKVIYKGESTAEPTVAPTAESTAKPTPVPTTEPTAAPAPTASSKPSVTEKPADTEEPAAKPVSLNGAKLTVKAQTYTGKALKPAVTVTLDGATLKKGTDYTVSYKNNKNVGTATVTVTGKGSYTGTAKATFKISPKKISGLKLTSSTKQLNASWKKLSGITGYQLQYGLKKSFAGARTLTVKSAKTVKATIKKLQAKKTYYVRIRAYKTVKKVKYVSAWSKAVKIKTK